MGWRKGTNSPSVRVTHPRAPTTVRGDISVHVCTINDGGEVAVVVMPQGSEEIDSHHGPGQLGEILQWGGGPSPWYTKILLLPSVLLPSVLLPSVLLPFT